MHLKTSINLFGLLTATAIAAALFMFTSSRITIDTNIFRVLPTVAPVIADGIQRLQINPVRDQIAIDIGSDSENPAQLVTAAKMVETRLMQSGLFVQVGIQPMQKDLTAMVSPVVRRLLYLFTAGELQRQVVPLLNKEAIQQALARTLNDRHQMDGIGHNC